MPSSKSISTRIRRAMVAALVALTSISNGVFCSHTAYAQAKLPVDFRAALEGYGQWVQHPRWGQVWILEQIPQGWQPYRQGHWVYTDEWGWYWDSDEEFGWVTYHYGRWMFDSELGWIWIPSEEWGPAWVSWRQGDDVVGWAPLPPDGLIDEDENPDTYIFVRVGDLLAPQIYSVILPPQDRFVYFRRCAVVNRSFVLGGGRRLGINPGISPVFIARASGRPFHSVSIAPLVVGGTVGVTGSLVLREGFRDREHTRINMRENNRVFQPNDHVLMPKALARGERGRLGDMPINAARGVEINPQLQKKLGGANGPSHTHGTASNFEGSTRKQGNKRHTQDNRSLKKTVEQKNRHKSGSSQKQERNPRKLDKSPKTQQHNSSLQKGEASPHKGQEQSK